MTRSCRADLSASDRGAVGTQREDRYGGQGMGVAPGRERTADALPELTTTVCVGLEPQMTEHGSGEDHRRVADDQRRSGEAAGVVDRARNVERAHAFALLGAIGPARRLRTSAAGEGDAARGGPCAWVMSLRCATCYSEAPAPLWTLLLAAVASGLGVHALAGATAAGGAPVRATVSAPPHNARLNHRFAQLTCWTFSEVT